MITCSSTSRCAIRELLAPDFVQWCELWREYLRFYETSFSDDLATVTFRRLCGADSSMHAWVAVAGDQLVGFAHAIRRATTWSPAPYLYLEDLFVGTPWRGQGIARALLGAVYQTADAARDDRVYWITKEDNYRARALYDRIAVRTPFVMYRRATESGLPTRSDG